MCPDLLYLHFKMLRLAKQKIVVNENELDCHEPTLS